MRGWVPNRHERLVLSFLSFRLRLLLRSRPNRQDLNHKSNFWIRGHRCADSCSSVSHFRRTHEFDFVAKRNFWEHFFPTLNYLINAQNKLKGIFPFPWRVNLLTCCRKSGLVIRMHKVTFLGELLISKSIWLFFIKEPNLYFWLRPLSNCFLCTHQRK